MRKTSPYYKTELPNIGPIVLFFGNINMESNTNEY